MHERAERWIACGELRMAALAMAEVLWDQVCFHAKLMDGGSWPHIMEGSLKRGTLRAIPQQAGLAAERFCGP